MKNPKILKIFSVGVIFASIYQISIFVTILDYALVILSSGYTMWFWQIFYNTVIVLFSFLFIFLCIPILFLSLIRIIRIREMDNKKNIVVTLSIGIGSAPISFFCYANLFFWFNLMFLFYYLLVVSSVGMTFLIVSLELFKKSLNKIFSKGNT